ncbi:Fe-S cluster assembly protein SufD [Arcticibacter tournemirensis]|uniref:Fe-S cluster assembly protein SufD n=2 Tax=Arcticibacter tournemirensis TaxID=699437 RepID=A0A5M9HHQ4_9SPHI|nr:Fe-S cluster assembly protein SufD [Arcticibacter tournemirensis]
MFRTQQMEKGIFNNFYQYLINRFPEGQALSRLNEPAWLSEKREAAFEIFKKDGLPSRKNEEWKFTNLERLLRDDYKFQSQDVSGKFSAAVENLEASRIFILNGKFAPDLSDPLPDGMTFLDTAAALADARFEGKLGAIANDPDNSMLALNTAFFKDYSVLHIEAKKVIERPVHVTHIYTGSQEAAFVPYRMLVVAEKLSEATLIETFHSDTISPVFVSYVSEQQIDESAIFHSHIVNTLGDNVYFIHHREVFQFRNSVLNNSNILLGENPLVRNDLNFQLKGTGTETNLIGAYIMSGEQHADNHTLVDHQMPNCNSSELYKGILDDRSRSVFNGKVYVRPDAQKTNAFQQNNNMLLSDQATVNSKPQLEIFADDVKCSHGSTVGQMNKEALFYLNSRGIGEDTARRLLMQAFVFDVLSRIEIPELRDYTESLLHKKLHTENLEIA